MREKGTRIKRWQGGRRKDRKGLRTVRKKSSVFTYFLSLSLVKGREEKREGRRKEREE